MLTLPQAALVASFLPLYLLLSESHPFQLERNSFRQRVNMASPVRPLGLTVLHAPEFPEVDIIFVHGLQGHPERTWTWAHQSHESLDTGSTSETHLGSRLRHAFRSKRREMSRSPSPSPSPNEHQKNDLFWPRDLLRHHSSCKNARVMTYGYDTNILSLADTCNFTTLSAHGESLLNRVAAARADHLHRPLMFITHSLGGLVVKSVCISG